MGAASFDSTTALRGLSSSISQVLLGKEQQLKLALSCLLAGGHLLIEDLPGMGKSTLAEALARGLECLDREQQGEQDGVVGGHMVCLFVLLRVRLCCRSRCHRWGPWVQAIGMRYLDIGWDEVLQSSASFDEALQAKCIACTPGACDLC